MIYELRIYRINAGQRDAFVRHMEERIIPFQASKGMVIVASFISNDDPDTYVWMRRFQDESDRERLYRAVYEDTHWINAIAPVTAGLLDRELIQVTSLTPTALSVLH